MFLLEINLPFTSQPPQAPKIDQTMADKPTIRQRAPVLGAAANGEIVTVFVGPKKRRYRIHKDLICHHSEYFRAAYNGRWQESDKGVTLEDVEIEVFNIFVSWLYTQQLPKDFDSMLRIAETDVKFENEESENAHCDMLYLKCSIFGDRFLAPGFHRLSHDMFVDWHLPGNGEPAYSIAYRMIIWSFRNFSADNLILAMMVDLQCLAWNVEDDNEEERELLPQLPHEFLLACMLRQSALKMRKMTDDQLRACHYYV